MTREREGISTVMNLITKYRLRRNLEKILHLNGCQQRTAGHNEAMAGKELDMKEMYRLEKLTLREVMDKIEEILG